MGKTFDPSVSDIVAVAPALPSSWLRLVHLIDYGPEYGANRAAWTDWVCPVIAHGWLPAGLNGRLASLPAYLIFDGKQPCWLAAETDHLAQDFVLFSIGERPTEGKPVPGWTDLRKYTSSDPSQTEDFLSFNWILL